MNTDLEQQVAAFAGRLARAGLDDEQIADIAARAFPEVGAGLVRDRLTEIMRGLGGHAPGDIRDAFAEGAEYLVKQAEEPSVELRGRVQPLSDVAALLWNCSGLMPSTLCDDLDLSQGSTYAQGARAVLRRFGDERR